MSTTPATLFAKPGWSRLYHFDFSNYSERKAGDALTGATISADAGLTVGTPLIDGDFVQVRVSGGVADTTYEVACAVSTSGGDTLSQVGYLAVGSGGAVVTAPSLLLETGGLLLLE